MQLQASKPSSHTLYPQTISKTVYCLIEKRLHTRLHHTMNVPQSFPEEVETKMLLNRNCQIPWAFADPAENQIYISMSAGPVYILK